MAKSQIIKDIANGTVSLETSLKRALVIASDLGNEVMSNWIRKELFGYSEGDEIPCYRRMKGVFKATFFVLGKQHIDEPITVEQLFVKGPDNQDIHYCYDGIRFLESACKDEKLRKFDKVEFKNLVRMYCDRYYLEIPQSVFENAVAKVSEKLFAVLLKIDNELGSLDNLDICPESKEKREKINCVINNFFGNVVTIGNDNEIKGSSIEGGNGNGK